MMKINISKLAEGTHEYELEAEPPSIGLDDEFQDKVLVAARLEKTKRQMYLKAKVRAVGSFYCDRCVEEFRLKLENEYELVYVTEQSDRDFYNADEVQVVSPEVNEIDIGEDVRQTVLLSVPQKLLCKESCAGLCPRCGRNLNREQCVCKAEEIDPRWERLRGLLNYQ
jgi:uncharacterized protein